MTAGGTLKDLQHPSGDRHWRAAGTKKQQETDFLRRSLGASCLANFIKYTMPRYHLSWFHKLVCRELDLFLNAVVREENPRLIITAPPRHGKLCADSTPVMTMDGWKTHGELRLGDRVIGSDGSPVTVLAVGPRGFASLEARFDNGEKIKVHPAHEWTLEHRLTGERRTLETRWIPEPAGDAPDWALTDGSVLEEVRELERPEPGRCIQVDAPDGQYLVGESMIPTHNSEIISRRFPAYVLGKYPDMQVIAVSYATPLSKTINRSIQNIITGERYRELYPDTRLMEKGIRAKGTYTKTTEHLDVVGHRGSYHTTGVGGGITGMGANCFVPGTLVSVPGGAVPIEDLKAGDEVLSWNVKTGAVEARPVTAARRMPYEGKILRFCIGTGTTAGVTPEHRIWSGGGYVEAGDLAPGSPVMRLLREDFREGRSGESCDVVTCVPFEGAQNASEFCGTEEVTAVGNYKYRGFVHDIQVALNSNFFADGVLVHNCLIIDDPVRNQQDARSKSRRDAQWEWYNSVFRSRKEKGAGIVIVHTRWHEDDLIGRIIEQQRTFDPEVEPEQWKFLNFPAIAEEDDEYRKTGDALWPEKYDVKALLREKASISSYEWAALYQQRPAPDEGQVFKKEQFKYWTELPESFDRILMSCDLSFTGGDVSDFVVIQVWGKRGAESFLIDQERGRMDFTATLAAFVRMTEKWPGAREKLVENKANGPALISSLKQAVPGIVPVNPRAGKVERAWIVTPYFNAGNIYFPSPKIRPWTKTLEDELLTFPYGRNDDQADALVQAIWKLYTGGPMKIDPAVLGPRPKRPEPFLNAVPDGGWRH